MFPRVLFNVQDSSSDVQQSTFALLGDLVLYATNHVTPHLSTIVPLLVNGMYVLHVSNIRTHSIPEQTPMLVHRCVLILLVVTLPRSKPERPKVTSNITWSLGELALKVGPAIGPAVETIIAKLGPTMNTADDGVTLRR